MSLESSIPADPPSQPLPTRGVRTLALIAGGSIVVLGGILGTRFVQAGKQRADVETQRSATHAAAVLASEKAPVVAVTRGTPTPWQPTIALEGSISAVQEVDLGFKVSGRIGTVHVHLGDHVRAGAVLASLDEREALAQVAAAQAQLRGARAQLALAEDAKGRVEALVQAGAPAQASGVPSTKHHELAAAQVDGAVAQLELARSYLASHRLLAPFAGTITRGPGGPGAVVNPMSPMNAVFHLVDARTLKLAGTIAENELGIVRPGDPVTVRVGERVVHGKLAAVVGSADLMTRRVPIEAVIENQGEVPLLPGQYVRASVQGGKALAALALPSTVLRPGSQDEIFVVREGKLVLRRVVFAVGDAGKLLVREGLDPAADVVLTPAPDAHEGDAVAAGVEGSR